MESTPKYLDILVMKLDSLSGIPGFMYRMDLVVISGIYRLSQQLPGAGS